MAFMTEYTQAQLDLLTRNMALGVLEVEHNGKRTKFQSLAQMKALRDAMKTELSAALGPPASMASMTRRTVYLGGR